MAASSAPLVVVVKPTREWLHLQEELESQVAAAKASTTSKPEKKHRICRKNMEISCIFSLLCKEITFIVAAEIQSLSSFFYGEL